MEGVRNINWAMTGYVYLIFKWVSEVWGFEVVISVSVKSVAFRPDDGIANFCEPRCMPTKS